MYGAKVSTREVIRVADTRPGKLKKLSAQEGKSIKELIAAALAQSGSVTAAAAILGINERSIRHWLERNGYTVSTCAYLVEAGHEKPEIGKGD